MTLFDAKAEQLGTCERVVVEKEKAIVVTDGSQSETEVNDKKLRYNDAMSAVRSAKEMGVVPGGGSVLVHLARPELVEEVTKGLRTEDERAGAELVFKSLEAPMRQIAKNAGEDPSEVLFKARGQGFGVGFNAATKAHE